MPTLTAAAFDKDGLRVDLSSDHTDAGKPDYAFGLNQRWIITAKKRYITMTVPIHAKRCYTLIEMAVPIFP